MRKSMTGTVTIVQEGRFQLTDDRGVAHLFLLGPNAGAETDQLTPLQHRQARVTVRYSEPANIIGNLATSITLID